MSEQKKGISKGLKVGIGCCGGLIVFVIILVAIGSTGTPATTPTPKPSLATKTPKLEETQEPKKEEPTPSLDLSFKAVDGIFGSQSDITDLQKKEQWSQYKGQRITWTCSVSSIDETFLGSGYTLNIKCNPSTYTSDTRIELGTEWKDKLLTFKEDDTITISGTLDSYGLLGYNIKNGEIK